MDLYSIVERGFSWLTQPKKPYSLLITSDLDGILSATLLQKIFGYQIDYFTDYDYIYSCELFPENELIGLDISLVSGKCIDNHVSQVSKDDYKNPECCGLNHLYNVTCHNYEKKYSGSSFLFLYSIFKNELKIHDNNLTRGILLCVDSFFRGYFADHGKFRETQKFYLCEVLQMPGLFEFQEKYPEQNKYFELQRILNMKYELKVIDNKLDFTPFQRVFDHLGLEMPKIHNHFWHEKSLQKEIIPLANIQKIDRTNMFSFVATYKHSGIGRTFISDEQKKIA